MPFDRQRAILRRAFDLGVTHFDLANNYGPPYGSAETNFGRHLADDFAAYRDELVISTKAGWDMWPGPYGQGGGGRKYMLASLDQSLRRMGLDYVDIFYHHRPDPTTPLEETMGALHSAVQAGKALYVGISSYSPEDTARAAEILADLGTPLLIHQPSYSMLNRWIETEGLLDTLEDVGAGCIAFSPLAQGMLTDKYLDGVPEGSRASQDKSLSTDLLTEESLAHVRALNDIAAGRGPEPGADGAGLGAARPAGDDRADRREQRPPARAERRCAAASLDFADDELAAIDEHAVDTGIDLWARPARRTSDGSAEPQRHAGRQQPDAGGRRGDAGVERAQLVAEPPPGRRGRHDPRADLVAHGDHAPAGRRPRVDELVDRRRQPVVGAGRLGPDAAVVHHPGQPGGQAVDQHRWPRPAEDVGQVERLDRPPRRRAADPVQGDAIGPLRVAAVGHRAAGDVVDGALVGEQLLGEGRLAGAGAPEHEGPPRPAETSDHRAQPTLREPWP